MNVIRPLLIVLFAFFCISFQLLAQTKTIYVAGSGSDSTGNGSLQQPFKTLERGQLAITLPLDRAYEIRLQGDIYATNAAFDKELFWTVSGDANYSIKIMSDNSLSRATIKRQGKEFSPRNTYIMSLQGVDNVIIENVNFTDAAVGIYIDNSKNCKILNCTFTGGYFVPAGGEGAVRARIITMTISPGSAATFRLPIIL
jgi:parallel beta-helix repeat protein